MTKHTEGHSTVPVDRDFVRKMEKFIRALTPEQQGSFFEVLRHAAEPATFLSRQEFEAQKEAEAAKHGLPPDFNWAWLEYHWLYPPVGKIGADWSYPEESAAGWDYPEHTEAAFLTSGGGSWEYSDYVPVFWGVVTRHLLAGGDWDTIPWSDLAAPSQLYRWSLNIPEEPTPQWNFFSSYERFLRGACKAANGEPGVRVDGDALMRALEISEDMYQAWVDRHVSEGNIVLVVPHPGPMGEWPARMGPGSDDYTTFVLTFEGVQWVVGTPYYRFLRGAYKAANGEPGVRVSMDTVMHASGLDRVSASLALADHYFKEGNVDSLSDDFTTFTLTSKAIQEVESTTKLAT